MEVYMRRNVVYADRKKSNLKMLEIYYLGLENKQLLMRTRFSPAIYKFFKHGKNLNQLCRRRNWVKVPTLSRLIDRRLKRCVVDIERRKIYEK